MALTAHAKAECKTQQVCNVLLCRCVQPSTSSSKLRATAPECALICALYRTILWLRSLVLQLLCRYRVLTLQTGVDNAAAGQRERRSRCGPA